MLICSAVRYLYQGIVHFQKRNMGKRNETKQPDSDLPDIHWNQSQQCAELVSFRFFSFLEVHCPCWGSVKPETTLEKVYIIVESSNSISGGSGRLRGMVKRWGGRCGVCRA